MCGAQIKRQYIYISLFVVVCCVVNNTSLCRHYYPSIVFFVIRTTSRRNGQLQKQKKQSHSPHAPSTALMLNTPPPPPPRSLQSNTIHENQASRSVWTRSIGRHRHNDDNERRRWFYCKTTYYEEGCLSLGNERHTTCIRIRTWSPPGPPPECRWDDLYYFTMFIYSSLHKTSCINNV